MTPYFSTDYLKALLLTSAQQWAGVLPGFQRTPWRAHSKVKGVGASCHFAVVGVLEDCGFKLEGVPDGPAAWARDHTESLMETWLDNSPRFAPQISSRATAGDVVGFRLANCIHHLGLMLPDSQFFTCLEPHGAIIRGCSEPQFAKRAARFWTPVLP